MSTNHRGSTKSTDSGRIYMVSVRIDGVLLPLASSHEKYWAIKAGKAAAGVYQSPERDTIEVREYPRGGVVWTLKIQAELEADQRADTEVKALHKAKAAARAEAVIEAKRRRGKLIVKARRAALAEAELQAEPEVISRIVDYFRN